MMKIIQIATDSQNAVYGLCDDGSLLVVQRGVWSECVDAPNHKSVASERDTYRDLCVELLEAAKDYLPYMPNSTVKENGANKHVMQIHKSDALKSMIARADEVLRGR